MGSVPRELRELYYDVVACPDLEEEGLQRQCCSSPAVSNSSNLSRGGSIFSDHELSESSRATGSPPSYLSDVQSYSVDKSQSAVNISPTYPELAVLSGCKDKASAV